jgi:FKBP-type peptidyl-prolyl cis-trans isomerase SlyD
MSSDPLAVADDLVVSLGYTLTLKDGTVVDSSEEDNPLEYLHGQGQIIPGLEQSLYGMSVGDEKQVIVEPSDGYGEVDDKDHIYMPRDSFPSDLDLEVGESVFLRDNESDNEYQAFVAEIGEDDVKLDFNHPLAGRTLYFDVKVEGLRQASSEELAHGHAHSPGHAH